jgi:methylase of polypeptide subunit release factors
MEGLEEWVLWPARDDKTFLVPMRRLTRILTDMKRSSEGMVIKALGAKISVLPHVYVPFDQSVVNLLSDNLRLKAGDSVLDVGTGTGVLAFVAARKGAKTVVATDVLENAVRSARLNASRLGLDEIVDVKDTGDLFEPVGDSRFDVIIFNPPWILGKAKSVYDRAIYDPGQGVVVEFARQARSFLTEGGRIYLFYSDASESTGQGSMSRLEKTLEENGLKISQDWQTSRRSRVLGAREVVHLFEIKPETLA